MPLTRPLCLLLASFACALPAHADDAQAQAIAAFRKEAQACKTAPALPDIGLEIKSIAGKTAAEQPPTPQELERVKRLLARSNLPFDTVNHRASYEFTLALTRVTRVASFKLPAGEPPQTAAMKDCLTRLAAEVGLDARFE